MLYKMDTTNRSAAVRKYKTEDKEEGGENRRAMITMRAMINRSAQMSM